MQDALPLETRLLTNRDPGSNALNAKASDGTRSITIQKYVKHKVRKLEYAQGTILFGRPFKFPGQPIRSGNHIGYVSGGDLEEFRLYLQREGEFPESINLSDKPCSPGLVRAVSGANGYRMLGIVDSTSDTDTPKTSVAVSGFYSKTETFSFLGLDRGGYSTVIRDEWGTNTESGTFLFFILHYTFKSELYTDEGCGVKDRNAAIAILDEYIVLMNNETGGQRAEEVAMLAQAILKYRVMTITAFGHCGYTNPTKWPHFSRVFKTTPIDPVAILEVGQLVVTPPRGAYRASNYPYPPGSELLRVAESEVYLPAHKPTFMVEGRASNTVSIQVNLTLKPWKIV